MSIHTPNLAQLSSNYPRHIAVAIRDHSEAHPDNMMGCGACEARAAYWISCVVWNKAPSPKKGWREVLRRVGMVDRVRQEGAHLAALERKLG